MPYQLNLLSLLKTEPDDLAAPSQTDAMVIMLPRIIFTSSMRVYGEGLGGRREESFTASFSTAGKCLVWLEN